MSADREASEGLLEHLALLMVTLSHSFPAGGFPDLSHCLSRERKTIEEAVATLRCPKKCQQQQKYFWLFQLLIWPAQRNCLKLPQKGFSVCCHVGRTMLVSLQLPTILAGFLYNPWGQGRSMTNHTVKAMFS